MRTIAVALPSGNSFGWGICGTRLLREFNRIGVDLIDMLANEHAHPPVLPCPMLHSISGPEWYPLLRGVYSTVRNVGLGFIEDMPCARLRISNAKFYDHVACGSSWMRHMLEQANVQCSLSTVIQGVDCEQFQPAPRKPDGKFNVFSGGKAEIRKGTDIAIAAMAQFMSLHPDVHLYAAWHNHWPLTMLGLRQSPYIKADLQHYPVAATDTSYLMHRVAVDNGIPHDRLHMIPLTEHGQMDRYYQMCDLGLFPNRCEAGNNMVMCELMACGIPVVASMGTGHVDVLQPNACFSIIGPTDEKTGWMEPSIESTVTGLEWAYECRGEQLASIGRNARAAMHSFTWEKAAQQLLCDLGL